ncbi:MAG: hypothetical protein EOO38_06350 [Cytophagaceae bacterium]|nr:MAG: hypothetical protein EOO38_06350 [Cytophagaceae bacterium]
MNQIDDGDILWQRRSEVESEEGGLGRRNLVSIGPAAPQSVHFVRKPVWLNFHAKPTCFVADVDRSTAAYP